MSITVKTDQQRRALIEALEHVELPTEIVTTGIDGTTVMRGKDHRIELGGFGDKPPMSPAQLDRAARRREHPELR